MTQTWWAIGDDVPRAAGCVSPCPRSGRHRTAYPRRTCKAMGGSRHETLPQPLQMASVDVARSSDVSNRGRRHRELARVTFLGALVVFHVSDTTPALPRALALLEHAHRPHRSIQPGWAPWLFGIYRSFNVDPGSHLNLSKFSQSVDAVFLWGGPAPLPQALLLCDSFKRLKIEGFAWGRAHAHLQLAVSLRCVATFADSIAAHRHGFRIT